MKITCLVLCFCAGIQVFAQRAAQELYPGLTGEQLAAMRSGGLNRSGKGSEGLLMLPKNTEAGEIVSQITGSRPTFIIESLNLVPKNASLLSIYTALGKIRGLKGRVYHSATKNRYVPLFEDATRIESAKRTNAIADPSPASSVPSSETIYARLKDTNFGNCYYTIKLGINGTGILCSLSNFRNISYGPLSVMKENKFNAVLYIEPVREGLLVYSAASAEVSDFVSKNFEIPSALRKRLSVIIGWVADGI